MFSFVAFSWLPPTAGWGGFSDRFRLLLLLLLLLLLSGSIGFDRVGGPLLAAAGAAAAAATSAKSFQGRAPYGVDSFYLFIFFWGGGSI